MQLPQNEHSNRISFQVTTTLETANLYKLIYHLVSKYLLLHRAKVTEKVGQKFLISSLL